MAETVAAQPLADDVTAEELAARPEQPRAPRNKSTEEAYASSANKWWPMFLKAVCWDGTEKGVFIDAAGDPIDGTFSQLFIWLYEQDGMAKSIYKAMLAWAQARLNKQRAERLLAPMPGYVCMCATCRASRSASPSSSPARAIRTWSTLGQWSQMQQRLLGSGCRPSPHGWNTVISRRLAPLGAKIEALLGTISQAGRATAAPAVMPLPSHEPKRKRKTTEESAAAQAAKRGPGGIPRYAAIFIFNFYIQLVRGASPRMCSRQTRRRSRASGRRCHDGLERWTCRSQPPDSRKFTTTVRKWRPPGDASRQLWRWHSYVYEEIERRTKAGESEVDALAGVQARLDAHAKPKRTGRGRPACPRANWKGLVRELQAAHPRRVEDVEADL